MDDKPQKCRALSSSSIDEDPAGSGITLGSPSTHYDEGNARSEILRQFEAKKKKPGRKRRKAKKREQLSTDGSIPSPCI